jgi:heme-degrading monooxygenase HmoA
MSAIQLHVDLDVDAMLEQQLLGAFRDTFSPAIRTQPGFLDVRLLKRRSEQADLNYRLLISFESEELRQRWVASDLHQEVWPAIERTLKGGKYVATLYDIL